MKTAETGGSKAELSSYNIRAAAARLARPDDPLAEWRFEFDEWRKAYSEFQKIEREQIISPNTPSEVAQRRHRYLLFLLLARGEQLGLELLEDSSLEHSERMSLLRSIDAFLGSLRDAWHTWYGEALPEDRDQLAKFLP